MVYLSQIWHENDLHLSHTAQGHVDLRVIFENPQHDVQPKSRNLLFLFTSLVGSSADNKFDVGIILFKLSDQICNSSGSALRTVTLTLSDLQLQFRKDKEKTARQCVSLVIFEQELH